MSTQTYAEARLEQRALILLAALIVGPPLDQLRAIINGGAA